MMNSIYKQKVKIWWKVSKKKKKKKTLSKKIWQREKLRKQIISILLKLY